ncbi:MAG TPA: hypothetical protein VK155_00810, partial [Bacteroidales bacterium]|nr:hypothetical protein [Bacteroidales bacterium]
RRFTMMAKTAPFLASFGLMNAQRKLKILLTASGRSSPKTTTHRRAVSAHAFKNQTIKYKNIHPY